MQSCQLERRPQKFVTLRVFPGDDIEANDRLGSYLLSDIFFKPIAIWVRIHPSLLAKNDLRKMLQ